MAQPNSLPLDEFLNLRAADLADQLQRLPVEDARILLERLPTENAAAALVEIEPEIVADLAAGLSRPRLAELLQRVAPEAVVDLLQLLSPGTRREMLQALSPERASSIRALLRYPEHSAGGIMTNRFIALSADMIVGEARDSLANRGEEGRQEDVAYLYVTDTGGRLVGIVSLRDLVFRPVQERIQDFMRREVHFVKVNTDQEELARQFEHYHHLDLPVLELDGRLVGVVKASDALEIARQEATEDMQLMVGLSGEERSLTPWHKAIGRRLPWLYVNLATAFVAAAVVNIFETTIAKWTMLAVFLPIIAGQGGNAGMQTLTVVIRDLALGEMAPGDGRRALLKEAILGVMSGLAIGLAVGVIAFMWKGSATLAVVAAVAMLLNHLAAAIAGVLIPLGLKLCRVDPALASSIFLTTITDIAGFFCFLGLASLALHWFAV